ncbi:MAG: YHYH protein [Pseudomonadota bacterium]
MKRSFTLTSIALTAVFAIACQPSAQHGSGTATAKEPSVTQTGGQTCIRSDGLPNHTTGQFPNRGNPNRIRPQRINVCVSSTPRKGSTPIEVRGSMGIAVNGVMIRPGTADWYDPRSPRGFSRDRSSGWNLEGMGAGVQLGLDQNNAHVDPRGLYHYHGIPTGLVSKLQDGMIGWAADGFPLYLAGPAETSSWRLKSGERPTPPYGAYDGTYVQDWEHLSGSGTLDQCNGGLKNGQFVYFVTDTYPFYPRCLWGQPSQDFRPPRR